MYFVINYDLVERFPQKVITYSLFAEFLQLCSLMFLFIFIKVVKGMACFHFPKSGVYLMSSDTENGLSGLSGDPTVGELYDLQGSSEFDQNITGSCVKVKGKKKCSSKDLVSSDLPYCMSLVCRG